MSDIGRFSLVESNLEGTLGSRARGLFEHGMVYRYCLRMEEDNRGGKINKRAKFRRAEKFDEAMVLRI